MHMHTYMHYFSNIIPNICVTTYMVRLLYISNPLKIFLFSFFQCDKYFLKQSRSMHPFVKQSLFFQL